MKTFGLAHFHVLKLERYMATVTNDKGFIIAKRRACSEHCGLDLSDLIRICEEENLAFPDLFPLSISVPQAA